MLQPGVDVDSVPVIEHDVLVTMGVVAAVWGAVGAPPAPGVIPDVTGHTGHWLTRVSQGGGGGHPVIAGVTLVAGRTGVGGLLPDPGAQVS